MKVAGYARVSTDLQKEKETIKTQIELIERLCEAQGHTLVETFCDDGVSGTLPLDARPAGRRAAPLRTPAPSRPSARQGREKTKVLVYHSASPAHGLRGDRGSRPSATTEARAALRSCTP